MINHSFNTKDDSTMNSVEDAPRSSTVIDRSIEQSCILRSDNRFARGSKVENNELRQATPITGLRSPDAIVLSLATTGPSYSPNSFPSIPTEIDDVLLDTNRAYDLGFRFFHHHARNPETGLQFSNLKYNEILFRETKRNNPGALVGGATSRKGEVELQIDQRARHLRKRCGGQISLADLARIEVAVRAAAVEARPDRITTFTPTELKLTNCISEEDLAETAKGYSELTRREWSNPEVMRQYYRALRSRCVELGVAEELELTTDLAFPVIERIADDPTLGLPRNLFVLFLFGYSSRLPINRSCFDRALAWVDSLESRAGIRIHVTVGAAIPPHLAVETERRRNQALPQGKHDIREVFEWVAESKRVDSFRVGLEDVPVMWGRPTNNIELAIHARELCSEFGIEVAINPDEVRRLLGIPQRTVDTSEQKNSRMGFDLRESTRFLLRPTEP
jgi:hypothetical protein